MTRHAFLFDELWERGVDPPVEGDVSPVLARFVQAFKEQVYRPQTS